jgi:hypothetical protein
MGQPPPRSASHPRAIASRVLTRVGLTRLSTLEPAEPPRRYQREYPGEMIHIDIKNLGKFNQIGHRITGDRQGQSNSPGSDRRASMSASTKPREWLSAK